MITEIINDIIVPILMALAVAPFLLPLTIKFARWSAGRYHKEPSASDDPVLQPYKWMTKTERKPK